MSSSSYLGFKVHTILDMNNHQHCIKTPSYAIIANDAPNYHFYGPCARHHIVVGPSDPVHDIASEFNRDTQAMQQNLGPGTMWENLIIVAHGSPTEMGICNGLYINNLQPFADIFRCKVKNIWLVSCLIGATANSDTAGDAVMEKLWQKSKKYNKKLTIDQYYGGANRFNLDANIYLVREMERLRPGIVKQLRNKFKTEGITSNSPEHVGDRRLFTEVVWTNLHTFAPTTTNHMFDSFASKLSVLTDATVWASPHYQLPPKKFLRRHSLDQFEGDLYKFSPSAGGQLITRSAFF
jgi:hypothetical protein